MKKFLVILILGFLLSACGNNKETRSLSHCADIKFINFANSNPALFIDSSKVISAIKKRDKEIKKWIKANYNPNALEGMGKVRAKMNDRTDTINLNLMMEITSLFSEANNIIMLNDKSIDYKVNYKREKLKNYNSFYKICTDEYYKNEKVFIKMNYDWQKQNISNLNNYMHKVFDDLQDFSKNYPFTTKMWELEKKMMKAIPK